MSDTDEITPEEMEMVLELQGRVPGRTFDEYKRAIRKPGELARYAAADAALGGGMPPEEKPASAGDLKPRIKKGKGKKKKGKKGKKKKYAAPALSQPLHGQPVQDASVSHRMGIEMIDWLNLPKWQR